MERSTLIIYILIAVFTVALITLGINILPNQKVLQADKTVSFKIAEGLNYDWGIIPILGGKVERIFTLKNTGTGDLKVTNFVTSCICTEATVKINNIDSPAFGMHTKSNWQGIVAAGQEAKISVVFDPMAHGPDAIGPITRTVDFITNDPKKSKVTFRLEGDVIKGSTMPVSTKKYVDITVAKLKDLLQKRDTFLLDVHIPEQARIKGTDQFIDYSKIAENIDKLPKDKNAEIVVYCRSGNMSKAASKQLTDLGYTNVKNLLGGTKAWVAAGNTVQ